MSLELFVVHYWGRHKSHGYSNRNKQKAAARGTLTQNVEYLLKYGYFSCGMSLADNPFHCWSRNYLLGRPGIGGKVDEMGGGVAIFSYANVAEVGLRSSISIPLSVSPPGSVSFWICWTVIRVIYKSTR